MTDTRKIPIDSLVVADFGRGISRAYLLESISGGFRFVAEADTARPPTCPTKTCPRAGTPLDATRVVVRSRLDGARRAGHAAARQW